MTRLSIAETDTTNSPDIDLLTLKYGKPSERNWGPRFRARAGYQTPDDIYEQTICDLVTPGTDWLDVGCGRDLFPHNPRTAEILASRCRSLTGVDPSPNIFENKLLHHRFQGMPQDFKPEQRYDLITLRMVAEHVTDPAQLTGALARLIRPGGRVVIYTVNKWSPVSLIAAVTPLSFHHAVKSVIWNTEEKDTFPTEYRMNTRKTLQRVFRAAKFREESFRYLDDCRSFQKYKLLNILELSIWRLLKAFGLLYPENCLLGIYVFEGSAQEPHPG